MPYENKLKQALLEKVQRYFKLQTKISKIEQDLQVKLFEEHEKYLESLSQEEKDAMDAIAEEAEKFLEEDLIEPPENLPEQESISYRFLGHSAEHKNLYDEFYRLQAEINSLLVECKYYPLMGLSQEESRILDEKDNLMGLSFLESKPPFSQIEKHLDQRRIVEEEEIKKRLENIPPLALNFHIDKQTLYFYKQVLKCYVYGAFEASIVLCRAIAETKAKEYIKYKGHGNLLVQKNKEKKEYSIASILKNILDMDLNIISPYSKINNTANNILHEKTISGEKTAINTIQLLQEFIKRFPKRI